MEDRESATDQSAGIESSGDLSEMDLDMDSTTDEEDDGSGDHDSLDAPTAGPSQKASTYTVQSRAIGAVELPAQVMNLDRAEKALGRVSLDWRQLIDPQKESIPLYLDPDSPFRRPITSHNAVTHNVLLKVTVPRRTGRRRKRGTDAPWEGELDMADADTATTSATRVCSIARLDHPRVLRRKLQDNVGKYDVEAVGIIHHTHRFRGTCLPYSALPGPRSC